MYFDETASYVKVCDVGFRGVPRFNMLPVIQDVYLERYENKRFLR